MYLEKDRENFETWKLKWNDFLINSINRAAVKEEQTKAALTAALSDDTLKWLNGQGLGLGDPLFTCECVSLVPTEEGELCQVCLAKIFDLIGHCY